MFQIRMVYEKADFDGLLWAAQKGKRALKAVGKIGQIAARFSGTLLILVGALSVFGDISIMFMNKEPFAFSIAQITISLSMILLGGLLWLKHTPSLSGGLAWKLYKEKGEKITYRFTETEFTEHRTDSDHRYDYSIIVSLAEDKERYYLMAKNTSHVIRKDSFLQGEPEDFGVFLQHKCGVPLVKV